MEDFAESKGIPLEVVRFGILLASGYILSICYRFIPLSSTLRHLYSIISTCFLTVAVFNLRTLLENLLLCLIIYSLVFFFKSKSWNPVVCFVVALGFMSHVHYQCQILNPLLPSDHSCLMMVLLIKMSSFGYCAYDGSRPEKELDQYQKEHCIREMPSLLEFLGYCFFFNGVWAGPAFEYRQYHHFILQKVYNTNKGEYKTIPNTTYYAVKVTMAGLFMLVIQNLFTPYYHFMHLNQPTFLNLSFLQKLWYLTISGLVTRSKFHTVWKLSEGAALISGVGYGIQGGKEAFDCAQNVDILGVETGENVKEMFGSWNKFTSNWLRRYVYVRVPIASLKLATTFFISAFWHGFHAGYYLSFLGSVPLTECGRTLRRSIRPIVYGKLPLLAPVYDILGRILSMFCLNYLFIGFIVRDFASSWSVWKNVYFTGHIIIILPLVLLNVAGLGKVLKKYHPKTEKLQ